MTPHTDGTPERDRSDAERIVDPIQIYRACVDAFIRLFELAGDRHWPEQFRRERVKLDAGDYRPSPLIWTSTASGTFLDRIISPSVDDPVNELQAAWANAVLNVLQSLGIESFRLAFPAQQSTVSRNLGWLKTWRWHPPKADNTVRRSWQERLHLHTRAEVDDERMYFDASLFDPPILLSANLCTVCGKYSVMNEVMWSVAAEWWARTTVPQATADGRVSQVIAQAFHAADDADCRTYIDTILRLITELGLLPFERTMMRIPLQGSDFLAGWRWVDEHHCPHCHAEDQPVLGQKSKTWELVPDNPVRLKIVSSLELFARTLRGIVG